MKDTPLTENLPVEKIVELIGISHNGWEEAVVNAVKEAAMTIRNIKEVDVKRFTAKVEKNTIVEYRAVVKITFVVARDI